MEKERGSPTQRENITILFVVISIQQKPYAGFEISFPHQFEKVPSTKKPFTTEMERKNQWG